jgi:photosystem II stability/assembly factor-like uncharacterized protein
MSKVRSFNFNSIIILKRWHMVPKSSGKCLVTFLSIFIFFLFAAVASGDPLDNWYVRNPLPQQLITNIIANSITFGNNTFVAVGDNGYIATSSDGITWTYRNVGTSYDFQAVTFVNNIFVAVGDGVFTSPDGITWTERAVPIPDIECPWEKKQNAQLKAITYGNGMFVAVGCVVCSIPYEEDPLFDMRYQILVSEDSINWHWIGILHSHANPGSCCLEDIAYGNGLFMAVGDFCVFTSSDGITWCDPTPNVFTDYTLHGITYANNRFVGVGEYGSYGAILTTEDGGITWDKRLYGIPTALFDVIYAENTFVAIGENCAIFTSSAGVSWSPIDSPPCSEYLLRSITYGKNKFVAVGGNESKGFITTSPDGITWETNETNVTADLNQDLKDIAYGENILVAVGKGLSDTSVSYGVILASLEGTSWIERSPGTIKSINAVAYGRSTFVAVGEDGIMFSSTDGITWNEVLSSITQTFNAITYGNNIFVAVGNQGTVLCSPDGITWKRGNKGDKEHPKKYPPITADLNAITYGKDLFVAVGNDGTIFTSSGSEVKVWKPRYSGVTTNIFDITFGNNTFVAVCEGDYVLTSVDGKSWVKRSSLTNGILRSVTFAYGTFVACGTDYVATSPDGINWTRRSLSSIDVPTISLSGITSGNSTFIAVGKESIIIQSDLIAPEPQISVSPDSLNFDSVTVGSSSPPQTITVTNQGTDDLLIDQVTVKGENTKDFKIQNDFCSDKTIEPSETCTVRVVFSPKSKGAKMVVLSFPSNDPDMNDNPYQVILSGLGVK